MPYNPTPIGVLIYSDPERAFERLRRMFEKHGTRRGVARACRVNESTVRRWLVALTVAGRGDPRPGRGDG
jgi:DNA invertase Pin-like site-specific DNA recombinase